MRSEQMRHGTLVLPVDRARFFIDFIGHNSNIMFEDMNEKTMQRPYKKFIQRIDEMERINRFLMDEIRILDVGEVKKNNVENFVAHEQNYKLDEVESKLKSLYSDFVRFKESSSKLVSARNALLEERYVAMTASAFYGRRGSRTTTPQVLEGGVNSGDEDFEFSASRSLLDTAGAGGQTAAMFTNKAGVILRSDQDRFAWALFRGTRGNTFTHFQEIYEPIADPKTGKEAYKSVFVIYYQNIQDNAANPSAMTEKINKICNAFGVSTYRWPESHEAAEATRARCTSQLTEREQLLTAHRVYMLQESGSLLAPVGGEGGNSLIEEWRLFCEKEKGIYATLNLFEGQSNLRASCWYPALEEEEVRHLLIRQTEGTHQDSAMATLISDRSMPKTNPPTYIRTNELTETSQELIDTYGLPRYQEANPMLFTIVTFPFLFGIMYGDVGHGGMLMCVGLYLIFFGEAYRYTAPDIFKARYMLAMMGFFGIYMGLLYNDFFSVGFNFFGSRWDAVEGHGAQEDSKVHHYQATYDPKNEGGAGPYPFGVDPAWHGATNELLFMNSLKMKLSVIVGVVQMTVGLLLRWSNAMYEKNFVDFFCECIPMMVFMICFFGFMDFMILYKWVTPMPDPPSIINSLICMAMWTEDKSPMFGAQVPMILMIMSLATVPVMLIPKPFILYMQSASSSPRPGHAAGAGYEMPLDMEQTRELKSDDEDFDFSEVLIHQVIETIEYVLGTVSHTASYLRLWALSLAHQQLSVVFFQYTILSGMAVSFPANAVALYLCFASWFAVTCGILLGMDVLECFLHTLRLHWVEFQSKFYKADGYAFRPYKHRRLLEEKQD